MAPEALPSNPLPSRATSNDISLLLSAKANRLRNSALFRNNTASTTTSKAPAKHTTPAEDSNFTPGGQNSGIGYVPSSSDKSHAKDDAATTVLRNKLLGKRKGRGADVGKGGLKGYESEEDEDEGRSGLGKRKKARKVRREEEDEVDTASTEPVQIQVTEEETSKVEQGDISHKTAIADEPPMVQSEVTNPKKKKKKKKSKT
ncbi:hypothetical protein CC79DRAFT_1328053 [Sarocladium strictum]